KVSDAKKLSTASMDLSVQQDAENTLDRPLDWPTNSDVVVPCTGMRRDEVVAAFKEKGVTEPKCIRCINPHFSDEARKAKSQGTVKLAIIVDEKGQVRSATIIKGDDYGNDWQSVTASKAWKLEPATRDGKPVAVCITVEVTFRLF